MIYASRFIERGRPGARIFAGRLFFSEAGCARYKNRDPKHTEDEDL